MSTEPEAKGEGKALFTAKEEAVLKAAWLCLKSGPPELDMEKLKDKAGFNTVKTATNTWGVIKKKLFSDENGVAIMPSPAKSAGGDQATPKKTKKGTATPKKRTKKVDSDDDEDDEEATPAKKKGRKSPLKKEIKVADMEEDAAAATEA